MTNLNARSLNKNNFDFLRHLFAFTVVLFHLAFLTQNQYLISFLGKIDQHIPIYGFFFISGFLISASYARSTCIFDYFKRRMKRLLPGYIVVIITCAILFSTISAFSYQQYFTSQAFYGYLLSNLSFLNFLHPCLPGVFGENHMCAVNGALWTIKVEVAFYLLVPLLGYFLTRVNKKITLLCVLYIAGIIYNYLLETYLKPVKPEMYLKIVNQLPSVMNYFVAGIILQCYFDFFYKNRNRLLPIALPIFIIEYYYGYEVFLPLALGVIICCFSYSKIFTGFNNFGKNGDFSYGIYIYHFPLIQLLVYLGLFNGSVNTWFAVAITLMLVFTLAFFSWHTIEKKALSFRLKK